MSNRENMVEEIKAGPQLDDEFCTLGELKSAVCSAYDEFGNAEFYYDTPVILYSLCIRIFREKTPEELEEEEKSKQRRKNLLRRNWENTARENGWKYE
jgi:hypothetical protein